MVVPVFIISCQVSLKPNIGPVIAHTMMTITASTKVIGLPLQRAVNLANRVNQDLDFVGLMSSSRDFEDQRFGSSQRSNELRSHPAKFAAASYVDCKKSRSV